MAALRPVGVVAVLLHIGVPGVEEDGAPRFAGEGRSGQGKDEHPGPGQEEPPHRRKHLTLVGSQALGADHQEEAYGAPEQAPMPPVWRPLAGSTAFAPAAAVRGLRQWRSTPSSWA